MREEDLARALAEYLRRERLNNEINLKKMLIPYRYRKWHNNRHQNQHNPFIHINS